MLYDHGCLSEFAIFELHVKFFIYYTFSILWFESIHTKRIVQSNLNILRLQFHDLRLRLELQNH